MKFCKECGTKMTEGTSFCKQCGTSVNVETSKPTYRTRRNDPKPAKQKKKWYIAAALIILLVAGYKTGEVLTDKDRKIERFSTAVIENDGKTVASLLTSHDSVELNEQTVQGFLRYLDENKEVRATLLEDLRAQANAVGRGQIAPTGDEQEDEFPRNLVRLQQQGKILFYDRYELVVEPVHLTVATVYEDVRIVINGEEVALTDRTYYENTFGPYLPGVIEVEGRLENELVDLVFKDEMVAIQETNQLELDLNGEDVTLDLGGIETADVSASLFVNGEEVGVDPVSEPTFGPVLTDGSMTVAVEISYPWGKAKTADLAIDQAYMTINLPVHDEVKNVFMNRSFQFFNEYFPAIIHQNAQSISTVTDSFREEISRYMQFPSSGGMSITYKGITIDDEPIIDYSNGMWTAKVIGKLEADIKEWEGNDRNNVQADEQVSLFEAHFVYDTARQSWLIDNLRDPGESFSSYHFSDEWTVKNNNPRELVSNWQAPEPERTEPDTQEVVGTIHDYLFHDSHMRRLTSSELVGLSDWELRIARNEIFARHGYVFESGDLNRYFHSKAWYYPNYSYDGTINAIEEYNVELIRSFE